METTLWSGKSSWSSLISFKNVVLAMLTGGLWLIIPIARILSSKYELTDQSFNITKGLLTQRMDQVELIRVKDIKMTKGLFSGTITIISTDKSDPVIHIKGIKNVDKLRQQIRSAVQMSKEKKGVRLSEHL